jgi:ABC-type sugar transport system ATPase subunit
VAIGGQVVDALSPKDRDIAMVFQHYALYPHLSVRDNLGFGLKMRGEPRAVIDGRIEEAAQLLDILPMLDRKPKELSGGQRQRVAMGRAIVRKPKLFLFDEPLSNLDAQLRSTMRLELKRLHKRLGSTMIYVTHDQVEAMTLGDTIALLDRGRIRQLGPPHRIYGLPADPFVAGFIGTPPMNLWEGRLHHQGSSWTFQHNDFSVAIPPLKSPPPVTPLHAPVLGIRPEEIDLAPPTSPFTELAGVIDFVEDLGADLLLHTSVSGERVIVRTGRGASAPAGKSITLYFPHGRLHLFVEDRRADWA